MEGVIGVVTAFAGNFAPKTWAFCNGQQMIVSQNQALFSIIGNKFGGDGQTTFNLPDLRGRAPVGAGTGQNITPYQLGQASGVDQLKLTVDNLPVHTHSGNVSFSLRCDNSSSGSPTPDFSFPNELADSYAPAPTGVMQPPAYNNPVLANAGASGEVPNRSPYLTLNFIICLMGIYPTRS
ncbi:MAG: tail fiber protein [Chitinophagaceae bacterium]